ncbi:hypothetical protein [Maribellus maritimus]|uniref:hypothetical protein n=1 Tax=Maribellus maritimus TaxID=2870838 RepID=UPI001EEBCCAE|nr:hypothetical protein [Maribellus maritimus]MCG6187209.1 hypothetical protein [Maribellus maritimus]
MKKIFSIIIILAVALLSCDQENMGTIYEPENPYVAFSSSVVPENFLTADNNFSVEIPIVRSSVSAPASAEVVLEMNDDIDGIFALESNTVTFEDGELVAYAKIVPVVDPGLLNPVKSYVFKLTLTGDNVSELFNTSTFTAFFEIDYIAAGTADFSSEAFEGAWSIELLKADLSENLTVYKAVDLYEEGYDIIIVVNGDNVSVADQAAWFSEDYGDVFVVGSGTVSGKVLTMSIEHYIPDVGSYGAFTEILTLP